MKNKFRSLLGAFVVVLLLSTQVFATGVKEGDTIISLGHDLTQEQRDEMLKRFGYQEGDQIIEVYNKEEHQYLGSYIPAEKIGYQAYSSAKVTYTAPGSGIEVNTSERVKYVTPDMYRQALETAGVKDAEIYVDAPMNVFGTAALTGVMKAYETSTGEKISEDVKQVANEELVVTSDLAETLGSEEAQKLINDVKLQIAKNPPQSKEEVRTIIINVSNEYNINLTDDQVNRLTDFFDNLRTADIDWNDLANRAQDYLNSEEGQNFLKSFGDIFRSIFDSIFKMFENLFSK